MGKIKKERCKLMISLFAAFLCFSGAHFSYQKALILRQNVNLIVIGDKITAERAFEIRRAEQRNSDEVTDFTMWTMAKEEYVEDREQIRGTKADVLEINGSSELLLFSGAVLHVQDLEGCLIGKGTAQQLFGSADAAGGQILYKGRLFTVRGILWETDNCMIVQAENDALFERITLAGKDGVTKSMQAERFCQSYGIKAGLLRTEILSGDLLRELAPAKWSDFEGFSRNLKNYKSEIAAFAGCGKSCIEQRYLQWKKAGGMLAVGGVILSLTGMLTGKNFFTQMLLIHAEESCNME